MTLRDSASLSNERPAGPAAVSDPLQNLRCAALMLNARGKAPRCVPRGPPWMRPDRTRPRPMGQIRRYARSSCLRAAHRPRYSCQTNALTSKILFGPFLLLFENVIGDWQVRAWAGLGDASEAAVLRDTDRIVINTNRSLRGKTWACDLAPLRTLPALSTWARTVVRTAAATDLHTVPSIRFSRARFPGQGTLVSGPTHHKRSG